MNCTCLKSLKLPLTAAFAVAAFSAQAADMYSPRVSAKDAPVYEAVPVWSGFYAGVNSRLWLGCEVRLHWTLPLTRILTAWMVSLAWEHRISRAEGGFGGGQIGYNLQRDHFVFGIEADIQGAAIKGNGYSEAAIANSRWCLPRRSVVACLDLPSWSPPPGRKATLTGSVLYAAGSAMHSEAPCSMQPAASHTAA